MNLSTKDFSIMVSTIAKCYVFFVAQSTYSILSEVMSCVVRLISQFKIFYSIIIFNMIFMVNNFIRFQISANMFFHDKAMFKNIPVRFCMRMFRISYSNISVRQLILSSFIIKIGSTPITKIGRLLQITALTEFFTISVLETFSTFVHNNSIPTVGGRVHVIS